jgi:hypothetical protein
MRHYCRRPLYRGPILAGRAVSVRYGKRARDDISGFLTYEAFLFTQGPYRVDSRNPFSYFRYWPRENTF